MSSERHSRLFAELTLLESMYPAELTWKSAPLVDPDEVGSLNSPKDDRVIEFSLSINEFYTLDFTLPPTYLGSGAEDIKAYVSCSDVVPTKQRKEVRLLLSTILTEITSTSNDEEVLDIIIQRFREAIEDLPSFNDNPAAHRPLQTEGEERSKEIYKRVVIWTHHLLSTAKRKDIVSWGSELGLTGFSRPGYPGSIFVEGTEGDVDEFVGRLKGLKWQALQVRDEDTGSERLLVGLQEGVKEVEGLGDIAEALVGREGCRRIFLEGMKIGVTGD